jgi:molybdopterin converting factor small subunit
VAHVVFACSDCQLLAGGEASLDVDVDTVRSLIAELERRHPGLGAHVERKVAISIDGEIHQDALFAPLSQSSEVFLIPRIGGG